MAHYAFLDDQNIVVDVITGVDEDADDIDYEVLYGGMRGQTCKRTSYNTIKGTHTGGKAPFRGTYAGIGYSYDPYTDNFYPPKPFNSWSFNQTTYEWEAPVASPNNSWAYNWDEDSQQWVAKDPGPKPYPSWTFNEQTNRWDPPVPFPDYDDGNSYTWNEETTSWVVDPA